MSIQAHNKVMRQSIYLSLQHNTSHRKMKKFQGQLLDSYEISKSKKRTLILISGFMSVGFIVYIWISNNLTVGGVPASVILKFIQDRDAVSAYINFDGSKVHKRLQKLEVEKEMKDYYRNQIPDPIELDLHIHQILFDRTGYVGIDYEVHHNTLVLKKGLRRPSMKYK